MLNTKLKPNQRLSLFLISKGESEAFYYLNRQISPITPKLKYGIFVIETKNYRGWIVGDEKSEYWTQVIYKRKESLYNPIRQNYGHNKVLELILKDFNDLPFINIVSFSVRADLKVKTNINEVTYTVNLLKTIQKYQFTFLKKEEVVAIHKQILSATVRDKTTKENHIKTLKNERAETADKIANNEFPKCGGVLVERSGKYGRFKGYGNFPNCRFILKGF